MKYLIVGLCLLFSTNGYAVELTRFSLGYERVLYGGKDATIYPSKVKERLNVKFNIGHGILFNDNKIHATTDNKQFRLVGLESKFGVKIDSVRIYFKHHSQHLLDSRHPYLTGYPVEDTLGIEWILLD